MPNFFETITVSEADEVTISNDRMQTRYGFEFQDPDTIARLKKIRTTPQKLMFGTPWYNLYSNSIYSLAFNYVPASTPEREKLIENGEPEKWEVVKTRKNGKEVKELTKECR